MMKILLNILLILITFFACYLQEIYLLFRPPQQQQPLAITVRAQQSFAYDQEKALSAKRKKALSSYIPLFAFFPQRIEDSKKRLASLSNEFLVYKAVKGKGSENLAAYIQDNFGVRQSPREINRLLKYRDLNNLLKGILTVQETTLQNKILESALYIKDKKSIEIHTPGTNESAIYAVDNLTTVEKARFSMQAKIRQLFWQVDQRVLDPLVQIAAVTIVPNTAYDHKGNERRLKQLSRQFPSRTVQFEPGDVLVSAKRVLQDNDVRLLTDYQKQIINQTFREAPWILFSILILVIFYNIFVSRIFISQSRNVPPRQILLSLMVLQILIAKASLIFTPFPIYVLPFSLLPLLVVSLNHGRFTAIATTIVAAALISLFCGRTFDIMLYFMFSGLTAVLAGARMRRRLLIFVSCFVVGIVNVISVAGMALDWPAAITYIGNLQNMSMDSLAGLFVTSPIKNVLWAFIGGIVSGLLALVLLPLLELSWQTASSFKLNRYTDLQHPTMKKLLKEARGTYQHSMAVAYLAQSAGEAVGANTLLLRIGAYYHDVGKMEIPGYFIENQFGGENPHDHLQPQESANVIIDHVRHGLKIGQSTGLPKVVVDLILQHHGTHLIEYFYSLATKTLPKTSVREDDFRYPGPKPQSVEAAILMIADAVEAASRSLEEPNRKNFEKMIRLVLVKRIVDGQFSDCDLTTRDLNKIVRAMVDSLEASFHSRISYPWQQKVVSPKPGTWRINKANDNDQKHRAFKP
jgi:putative nucleotidyltransferase with HDIG domain